MGPASPASTAWSVGNCLGATKFISQYCNLNITKLDVKNISGVSEVTITKCFKKLDLIHEQLLPGAILNKYKN